MNQKKTYLTSPAGEAIFPYLNIPDKEFYQNGDGKYTVSLLLDPEVPTHARFIEKIEKIGREKVGDDATLPIRDEDDKYGNSTGRKLVKFSSKYRPKLFDSSKSRMPEDKLIGRGSVIRVAATVNIYKNIAGRSGVNLYLNAVQVISLVEPGTNAEAFGFKSEEESPFEGQQESPPPGDTQNPFDLKEDPPF